jgi:hypothetical protein
MEQQVEYGTPNASSYGARSKTLFKSEVAFKIVSFEVGNNKLERYTRLAQKIGFNSLKDFLENECQKALFALTLEE